MSKGLILLATLAKGALDDASLAPASGDLRRTKAGHAVQDPGGDAPSMSHTFSPV